ncbi:MAG: hypothetical protein IPL22_19535 [Bacteroidetes bacterium]|nr:hypothetical protein [Bacteroidota bacterium]
MNKLILTLIFLCNFSLIWGQNILFDRHYELGTWTAGWSMVNLQDSAFIVVGSNDSLSSAGDKYSGFISKFDYEGNMVKADQYITTDTIFYQTYNFQLR